MNKFEYVWLDGYLPEPNLRSKVKINSTADIWSFDGSSTKQATGDNSDCILKPVAEYKTIDRIRPDATRTRPGLGGTYVMCEVLDANHEPHESNTRTYCEGISDDWWFGFEQEYFMYKNGRPLGWPSELRGDPEPQGEYYCGVGTDNVVGRAIADRHTEACMNAGIGITGTNAEVALGQWEYQILGKGTKAGDDLWMSRYILIKIAEKHGVNINLHPKPQEGDWNGSGMHTNFSNSFMRNEAEEIELLSLCHKLGLKHEEAMKLYGSNNDLRLTGKHETQSIDRFTYGVSDRGASIRIPAMAIMGQGYLEDRRPASNADPYKIMRHIVEALEEE